MSSRKSSDRDPDSPAKILVSISFPMLEIEMHITRSSSACHTKLVVYDCSTTLCRYPAASSLPALFHCWWISCRRPKISWNATLISTTGLGRMSKSSRNSGSSWFAMAFILFHQVRTQSKSLVASYADLERLETYLIVVTRAGFFWRKGSRSHNTVSSTTFDRRIHARREVTTLLSQ